MSILVLGGAGYIGSHICKLLALHDREFVVFDNLSTGNKSALKWGVFEFGDIRNKSDIENVFSRYNFETVIHLCDLSIVSESVKMPHIYYENNVLGTINLINVMIQYNVRKLIYSSSAAIYGLPRKNKIIESDLKEPINTYGKNKLLVEKMLEDLALSQKIFSVALRYFNAAGADPDGEIGENRKEETHLIPNLLNFLINKQKEFKIYGSDYNTPDGTCIRDYVHVEDLSKANLLAESYLNDNLGYHAFNLGNDVGFSNLEIIKECERQTGLKVIYKIEEKRPNDPDCLIANSSKARDYLKWIPSSSSLNLIISTALLWHKKL